MADIITETNVFFVISLAVSIDSSGRGLENFHSLLTKPVAINSADAIACCRVQLRIKPKTYYPRPDSCRKARIKTARPNKNCKAEHFSIEPGLTFQALINSKWQLCRIAVYETFDLLHFWSTELGHHFDPSSLVDDPKGGMAQVAQR